jgi:hypothetical protein
VSPVKYELSLYIPEDVILHSHCRENLKSYVALTGWTLYWRHNVSPVKYELGFYIPEDDILHGDRCEHLKSPTVSFYLQFPGLTHDVSNTDIALIDMSCFCRFWSIPCCEVARTLVNTQRLPRPCTIVVAEFSLMQFKSSFLPLRLRIKCLTSVYSFAWYSFILSIKRSP